MKQKNMASCITFWMQGRPAAQPLRPAAFPVGNRPPKKTDAQSVLPIFLIPKFS